ncbi:MAG: hypothetical protein BWY17_02566 [Deltaproteobacteria bacterium ADurb.Bin207]|jgi:hypothetical protein|nr:MAG: hypothetical protein BWY17_02566 [Deltaproteobacteria bacterium ADurb.Bin207]
MVPGLGCLGVCFVIPPRATLMDSLPPRAKDRIIRPSSLLERLLGAAMGGFGDGTPRGVANLICLHPLATEHLSFGDWTAIQRRADQP